MHTDNRYFVYQQYTHHQHHHHRIETIPSTKWAMRSTPSQTAAQKSHSSQLHRSGFPLPFNCHIITYTLHYTQPFRVRITSHWARECAAQHYTHTRDSNLDNLIYREQVLPRRICMASCEEENKIVLRLYVYHVWKYISTYKLKTVGKLAFCLRCF